MKKYVVRLTDEERKTCEETIGKLKGSSQKARRARILLQVDVDGPAWTDRQVAEAFHCRVQTVEDVRRRCVLEGFELALAGQQRASPPVPNLLDGAQEAQVIALRHPATGTGRCGCWRGGSSSWGSSPRSATRR